MRGAKSLSNETSLTCTTGNFEENNRIAVIPVLDIVVGIIAWNDLELDSGRWSGW
jgi:hypothetical protein